MAKGSGMAEARIWKVWHVENDKPVLRPNVWHDSHRTADFSDFLQKKILFPPRKIRNEINAVSVTSGVFYLQGILIINSCTANYRKLRSRKFWFLTGIEKKGCELIKKFYAVIAETVWFIFATEFYFNESTLFPSQVSEYLKPIRKFSEKILDICFMNLNK